MLYRGEIIDAHMHLWDYESGNYPWLDSELPGGKKMLGDHAELKRNYLISDYQQDTHATGVSGNVHVQVFGYPDNPVLETRWLSHLRHDHKKLKAIVGYVDLAADDAKEQIDCQRIYLGFCGVRNVLCYHDCDHELRMIDNPQIFLDKKWQAGFEYLTSQGFLFETQIFDMQITALTAVLNKYPKAKVIINHLAWPTDFSKAGFKCWQDNVSQLVAFDNVYIKISALGCVFKRLDKTLIEPYLHFLIETMGGDRCCVGSNFPVDGLFFSFTDLYQFYFDCFSSYSIEQQTKLFSRNAKQFYTITGDK